MVAISMIRVPWVALTYTCARYSSLVQLLRAYERLTGGCGWGRPRQGRSSLSVAIKGVRHDSRRSLAGRQHNSQFIAILSTLSFL